MDKLKADVLFNNFQHRTGAQSDEEHIRANLGAGLSAWTDHINETIPEGQAKKTALKGVSLAGQEIAAALQAGVSSYINSNGHITMKQVLTDSANGMVKLEQTRYNNAVAHLKKIASYLD